MAKLTLNTIGSRYGSVEALNDNFDAIEQALENTFSLDGTSPNALEADLDMNSNDILNAGEINTDTLRINGVLVEPSLGVTVGSVFQTYEFTASAGQTSFSVSPATPQIASITVLVNGLQLSPSEISVSGTNVILPAMTVGDEVVIRRYTTTPASSSDASNINFLQTGTGATTRTVQSVLRDSISVKDFGATGNGTTDDTSYIQAAIDYAEINGGSVFFPRGTYLTSAELVIDKPGVELYGEGTGTTWDGLENPGTRIVGTHTTGSIIRIKWENCTIRNMVVDASSTRIAAAFGTTKCGIRVEADDVASPEGDVFSTILRRVYVRNQPGDGILMIGRTYQSIVEDCYSTNNKGHGFCLDGGNRTSRVNLASPGVITLVNVYCYYNEGHGIAIGNPLDDGVTHTSSVRVLALNCESSSNTVNTGGGIAYLDYDAYVRGDNNTFITCAFSGKNKVGTVNHHGGVAVAGRLNHFKNCRYLDPIYAARIFNGTGVTTVGTEFIGMSLRNPLNTTAVLTDSGTTWTKVEITDTTGALTAATTSDTTDGISTRIGKDYYTHGTFQVSDFKSTKTRPLLDDGISQITFSDTSYGIVAISGPTLASGPAIWAFRVGTSPYCYLLAGNAIYSAATTGIMTGTTGVDGFLTLSAHTDNKLYLENRTGATRNYEITFLSVNNGRLLPGS